MNDNASDQNITTPATPASISAHKTSTRGGRLGRLVALAAIASFASALASVTAATFAVQSSLELRRARVELDATRAEIAALLARPNAEQSSEPRPVATLEEGSEPLPNIEVHIAQARIDEVFADASTLATHARIVPAFEGGKAVGFKLFSIRASSFYAELGLQNGDVVRRINGYDMTSPDKALEVYTNLRGAHDLVVDVKRRGHPLQIHITIVPVGTP